MKVKRKEGESIDRLMARFKKSVIISGMRHDVKRCERHVTPSEKRNVRKQNIKFRKKKQRQQARLHASDLRRRKRLGITSFE